MDKRKGEPDWAQNGSERTYSTSGDAELARQSVTDGEIQAAIGRVREHQRIHRHKEPGMTPLLDAAFDLLISIALRQYRPEPTDGEVQSALHFMEVVNVMCEGKSIQVSVSKKTTETIIAALRAYKPEPCEPCDFCYSRYFPDMYDVMYRKISDVAVNTGWIKPKFCPNCGRPLGGDRA